MKLHCTPPRSKGIVCGSLTRLGKIVKKMPGGEWFLWRMMETHLMQDTLLFTWSQVDLSKGLKGQMFTANIRDYDEPPPRNGSAAWAIYDDVTRRVQDE